MIRHLTTGGVLAIHEEVLAAHGGAGGVREMGLLESAVAAPQATFGGEPLMTDPVEIAAAYLFYLCRNHPFVDGNKRTALASCLVFLEENGLFALEATLVVDDWEALVLEIAASRLNRARATARLRALLKKPRAPRRTVRRKR